MTTRPATCDKNLLEWNDCARVVPETDIPPASEEVRSVDRELCNTALDVLVVSTGSDEPEASECFCETQRVTHCGTQLIVVPPSLLRARKLRRLRGEVVRIESQRSCALLQPNPCCVSRIEVERCSHFVEATTLGHSHAKRVIGRTANVSAEVTRIEAQVTSAPRNAIVIVALTGQAKTMQDGNPRRRGRDKLAKLLVGPFLFRHDSPPFLALELLARACSLGATVNAVERGLLRGRFEFTRCDQSRHVAGLGLASKRIDEDVFAHARVSSQRACREQARGISTLGARVRPQPGRRQIETPRALLTGDRS